MFFLFVDGLGLPAGPSPVHPGALPTLFALARGADAGLGVAGLPQSGTGQTTLLTGVNAARVLGRHFGPFPGGTLRKLLAKKSLFASLQVEGLPWLFANSYSARYLTRLDRKPAFASAFALAARAAGQPLLNADDARALDPLLADPRTTAREVRERLKDHALVALEVFMLDYAGHRAPEAIPELLARLEAFLAALVHLDVPFLLASDHGNAEEPGHPHHTHNPAILAAHGLKGPAPAELVGVKKALLWEIKNRRLKPADAGRGERI